MRTDCAPEKAVSRMCVIADAELSDQAYARAALTSAVARVRSSDDVRQSQGMMMAADEKKTSPKKEPASKSAEAAPKVEAAPKAEVTPKAEKADAAPKRQGMGEGQKPVTQAYKDNWNAIFGKKKKR